MATNVLFKLGAEFLRHYCQGIWLKNGHPRFYRHVDGFYSKLLARMEKHELQAALIRPGTVMSKGTATADYIMEDPREAIRLEVAVRKPNGNRNLRPSGKVGHAEDLVSRRQ